MTEKYFPCIGNTKRVDMANTIIRQNRLQVKNCYATTLYIDKRSIYHENITTVNIYIIYQKYIKEKLTALKEEIDCSTVRVEIPLPHFQ